MARENSVQIHDELRKFVCLYVNFAQVKPESLGWIEFVICGKGT